MLAGAEFSMPSQGPCQFSVSKYHRLGGLNNKHLFLTIVECGKSKIKVLEDSVSGEGSRPSVQMAAFLLSPHRAQRELFLKF